MTATRRPTSSEWSQALSECYDDEDLTAEAIEWMEHWGDDTGWKYWTTTESIPEADPAPYPEQFIDYSAAR